jgi:hypothetical protein
VKVSELSGGMLDAWVARLEGTPFVMRSGFPCREEEFDPEIHCNESSLKEWKCWTRLGYSSDWGYGGPIIEKAAIGWRNRGATSHVGVHKGLSSVDDEPWEAWFCDGGDEGGNGFLDRVQTGKTLLIASMRAFVASKYGEEVPYAGEEEQVLRRPNVCSSPKCFDV